MRTTALLVLLALGALGAAAQGPLPQSALDATTIQRVKGNLYVITGADPTASSQISGGNTGVLVTDGGVVVVDTKLSGWGPVLLDRIRTVTDKPVTMIINTHTHGDHTGSNSFFPASVEILAHANTKTNMAKMPAFQGDNARYLPKRTFTDTVTVNSGSDQLELHYFGAGHTDGDAFVLYRQLRVLQTGDMLPWKDAPLIDRGNGGSGVAYPKTLAGAVARFTGVDAVIPGHSGLMTRADLEQYQRFTADLLAESQTARRAGKSATEAAASMNLRARYPGYRFDQLAGAVQAIYAELDGR